LQALQALQALTMYLMLDFDGVTDGEVEVNPAFFTRNHHLWDLLRAAPMLQVVFSTSWRRGRSLSELTKLVTAGGGEDLAARFVGCTPVMDNLPDAGWREAEILAWLQAYAPGAQWIAIDDCPQWFVSSERLVVTQAEIGMTADAVAQALDKLGCF
jgi:hypothetical protein